MPKNYQTLQQAEYKYICFVDGEHWLLNKETGLIEVFVASKNFAGWAIKFRNTHLEFCSSKTEAWMRRFKNGLNAIQNYGEQHNGFKSAHAISKKLSEEK